MFYNIPNNRDDNLFIIPGNKSSQSEWKAWTVPSAANYISMIAIGPGGDGGLGRAVANGSAKGGGGGGGSGAITRAIFRARTLPSTIYLDLSSTETTVALEANNTINYKILLARGGGNGGNSTGAAAGVAGTGGTIATDATAGPPPFLASAVTYNAVAGVAGGPGDGTSFNLLAAGQIGLTGGAGGGPTTATPAFGSGGEITSTPATVGYYPTIAFGSAGISGNGGNGGNGVWFWKPLLGTGGGGGGAGNGLPGKGGNGAFGCGGGGGGSCVTADPNAGGKGGPGLLIIKCF